MSSKYTWQEYSAVKTGINASSIVSTADLDMNPIAIAGADLVQLYMTVVNATGVALLMTATLETRTMLSQVLQPWMPMQTRAITAGVETWSDRTYKKTWTLAAGTYYGQFSFDDIGPADQFRLSGITTTNGGATDLLSITARVRIPTG